MYKEMSKKYYNVILIIQNYCSTHWSEIESWKNSSRFPRADAERYRSLFELHVLQRRDGTVVESSALMLGSRVQFL